MPLPAQWHAVPGRDNCHTKQATRLATCADRRRIVGHNHFHTAIQLA